MEAPPSGIPPPALLPADDDGALDALDVPELDSLDVPELDSLDVPELDSLDDADVEVALEDGDDVPDAELDPLAGALADTLSIQACTHAT